MTEIKLSEAEIKMIELKREEERIEKEKKEIESQIEYQKEVEYHKSNFYKGIEREEKEFEKTKRLYEKLVEDGLEQYIKFVTSTNCKNFELPSYSDFGLKEEDKILSIQVMSAKIDICNFGSVLCWQITDDLKFELPYGISKRYQQYSYKTALIKIKEAIERYNQEQITKSKKEIVKEDLKKYFLELDSKCIIKEGETWDHGHTMQYLDIYFENTNYIRIKYYSDGSWVIIKQIDNRLPKDKFEIVQYLAK